MDFFILLFSGDLFTEFHRQSWIRVFSFLLQIIVPIAVHYELTGISISIYLYSIIIIFYNINIIISKCRKYSKE